MPIPARARAWAKSASFFAGSSPMQTQYSPYSQTQAVSGLMQTHFPERYARDVILKSPNVSFQDRVSLLGALQQSAGPGSEKTTVKMENWLPAAVGAGLGVVGAALTAPIFGLTSTQKKVYGIGAGALGAVLNTYGRD
jgi:hypothetical protein